MYILYRLVHLLKCGNRQLEKGKFRPAQKNPISQYTYKVKCSKGHTSFWYEINSGLENSKYIPSVWIMVLLPLYMCKNFGRLLKY